MIIVRVRVLPGVDRSSVLLFAGCIVLEKLIVARDLTGFSASNDF